MMINPLLMLYAKFSPPKKAPLPTTPLPTKQEWQSLWDQLLHAPCLYSCVEGFFGVYVT